MAQKPNEHAIKEALKEGLREWLDDKYAEVGKWTVRGITVMIIATLTYLALSFAGWKPPVPISY